MISDILEKIISGSGFDFEELLEKLREEEDDNESYMAGPGEDFEESENEYPIKNSTAIKPKRMIFEFGD